MKMSKPIILSVTAHPDDEALGFGATAAKYSADGYQIYNCMLAGEVDARRDRPTVNVLRQQTIIAQKIMGCQPPILGDFPNIKFNTVPHLELVQFIESVIEKLKPTYIFTHHPNDLNNDHYHTSKACQAAARLCQRKTTTKLKGLYFMEVLSSTDWAFPTENSSFQANTFFEIGKTYLEIKIRAIESYKGVMRAFPHPRSREVIKSLAAYRGGQSGMIYAEAFQTAYQALSI